MQKVSCPYCGYPSRAMSSQDGQYWKYVCERCGKIFVVDAKTGKVV